MLIIASLASAHTAYDRYGPARVISLMTNYDDMPSFPGLDADNHLKLVIAPKNCDLSATDGAKGRAKIILDFLKSWDREGNILVHCELGVSRSTATGFLSLCLLNPDASEEELLAELRGVAPHADPCPALVSCADDLLSRDGRMLDALLDLPPPISSPSDPIICLPTSA